MRKLQFFKVQVLSVITQSIFILLLCTPLTEVFGQCVPLAGKIQGIVFNDNNNDGVHDLYESGVVNAFVSVYDASNNLAGYSATASDGSYTISGLTNGQKYKVVIESIGALQPSKLGSDNASTVQFITAPACNASAGLVNYGTACSTNPEVITTCFVQGVGINQNVETVVGLEYEFSNSSTVHKYATYGQTGSVWGIAYKHSSSDIFTSAFVKQNSSLKDGPGAIYKTKVSGTTGTTSLFVKMSDLGIDVGQVVDGSGNAIPAMDCSYGDAVGRIGLGSLILSPDEKYLYTINLKNKSIVRFSSVNPTPATTTEINIPDPSCDNNEFVAFALKYHNDKIYVGVTCIAKTAQLATKSIATVYEFDPSNSTFTNIFSTNYIKGYWHDNPTDYLKTMQWLTDIDFTDRGNMVLGISDRTGHRYCNPATNSRLDHQFADILMVWNDNGTWKIENNGKAGTLNGAGISNGQGPGGGEFFGNDYWISNPAYHPEIALGSIYALPGSNSVVATVFDPGTNSYSGGLHRYSTVDGSKLGSKELYTQQSSILFGKATGFGDLIGKCGITDIEIGNFVWFDDNKNGIQDADELPASGVDLQLLDTDCNVVSSATTDANGHYLFTGLNPDQQYYIGMASSLFDSNEGTVTLNNKNYTFTLNDSAHGVDNSDVTLGSSTCGNAIIPIQTSYTSHAFDIGLVLQPGFDLSLRKVVVSNSLVRINEDVLFRITVFNQGGVTAKDVEINDYIPSGYAFNAAQNQNWVYANGTASTTITSEILPGQSVDVDITLKVVSGDINTLINIAEISAAKDKNGNAAVDIDSHADNNANNDAGGNINTNTDNQLDGNGTDDEDDQDPAQPLIFDLALKAEMDFDACRRSGDDVTINICVINQGNVNASSFRIVNYGADQFTFNADANPGWSLAGGKLYYEGQTILVGEKKTIPLHFRVSDGLLEDKIINYSEIASSIPEGYSLPFDFDSTPDNTNGNDIGGVPGSNYDNHTADNGQNDEDDHDPVQCELTYLDLALKMTTNARRIEVGDHVCFDISIYNQGKMPVSSVDIVNYLPYELKISDSDWTAIGGNSFVKTINFSNPLGEGKEYTFSVCTDVVSLDKNSLITDFAEIKSVINACGKDAANADIDSKADAINGNDAGGHPNTSTDNTVNETPAMDEDDHDPAQLVYISKKIEGSCGVCLSNATTPTNGQFEKDFQIYAPPGMTWYVDQAVNIYNSTSAAPPAAPTPFVTGIAGDLMVETVVSTTQSLYSISGIFVHSTNYSLRLRSDQDDYELFVGGGCSYDATPVVGTSALCVNSTETYSVPLNIDGYIPTISGGGTIVDQSSSGNEITVEWGATPGTYQVNFTSNQTCQAPGILNVSIGLADLAMSCKSDINLSLDGDCSVEITPSMIVAGTLNPSAAYSVMVTDAHGNVVPGNLVDANFVGKSVTAKLIEGCSKNSCWSTIHIEDKTPPKILCEDVVVACFKVDEYPGPTALDNCSSNVKLNVLDSATVALNCDPQYSKEIRKTYQAVDAAGNKSKVCEQVIHVKRIAFADIEYPADIEMANALSCGGYDVDEKGNPHPYETGFPTIQGFALYPDFDQHCNVVASYVDADLGWIGCAHKLMRTWTVYEYWCSDVHFEQYVQTLIIADNEPPSFTCPNDVTASASFGACEALVHLPLLSNITDDCSNTFKVDIVYPGGFLNNQNGGNVVLPVGIHKVKYTVYDQCLNRDSCFLYVTVLDKTPPTVVCKTNTTVGLTSEGIAYLYAQTLNTGSYDACGIEYMEARRMDLGRACGPIDSLYAPIVDFCCADAGKEVMVELRVYDAAGNKNSCMVNVQVQDKTKPRIICPDSVTISCEVVYNLNDLDQYGTAEAIDACGATVTSTAAAFVNQCRVGYIDRTFVANDGSNTATCVQRIHIKNFNPFNVDNIDWPDDYATIEKCSPLDLDPDNLPERYSKPKFDEGICDLVAATHEDKYYPFEDGNGSCFKILRTWYVIDWCNKDNPGYEPTIWQQTIKVSNNIAPHFTSVIEEKTQCIADQSCIEGYIELTASAADDCTPAPTLRWKYQIDYDFNGTFIPDSGTAAGSGGSADASGIYPVGTHYILWSFEDMCGNVVTKGQLFHIINCKGPQAVCKNGVAIELVPMDLNGDGIIDTEMSCISAASLNASSSHPCNYPLKYSFSEDINDTIMCFNCFNLGPNDLTLYVHDPYGYFDVCSTTIDVQDNNNVDFCPDLEDCINWPVAEFEIVQCTQSTNPQVIGSFASVKPDCMCGVSDVTFSDNNLSYPNATCTIIERTWSVRFSCGTNPITYTFLQKIKRLNVIAPTITCPANITVNTDANCTAAVTVPLATITNDGCSTGVTVTQNSAFASPGPNASGTYPSGTTNVRFTVSDFCGHSNSCTMSITVVPDTPVAQITGDNSICVGESTTLTASGGGTYVWNTTPAQTTASITVNPIVTTNYIVTVTSTTGCTSTASRSVTVSANPDAQITGDNTICLGETTILTATGGTSFLWSTGANTSTISVHPNISTQYAVTVTNNAGCTDVANFTLTVVPPPGATISGGSVICQGSSVTLTASGGGTYLWNTTPAQTTAAITVSPASNFTYIVTVTDANGCTATASHAVAVNPLPVAVITGPTQICLGESATLVASGGVSYHWNTNSNNSSIVVSPTSETTYIVTVTDVNGCTDTESHTIFVNNPPIAQITGNTTICAGASTTLTASGGANYLWSTGATTAAITVSPATTTAYTVTVSSGVSCTSTASVTVTVNALPQASITGNNVICVGDNTTLTASGGVSYIWSTGATTASINVAPLVTTPYMVTVTNAAGCTSTASRTVTVNPLPTITITGNNLECPGDTSTITATGGGTYLWSTGATTATIIVTPLVTTTYYVTVTSTLGCVDSDSIIIMVNDGQTPMAICQDITVEINNSGGVTITADDVDGGSMAECGGALTSKTVEPNSFDCADVNIPQIVTLTVTSNGGSSSCTANVMVIDTTGPVILCPDITISCEDFNGDLATLPMPTAGDQCSVDTITVVNNVILNSCHYGTVIRTYTAVDTFGNISAECTQIITIQGPANVLTLADITFPEDTVLLINCSSIDPSVTGNTIVDTTGLTCYLLGVTYQDSSYNGGMCNDTILRHWTVMDTCLFQSTGNGVFTFDQIIIVNDNSGPILMAPADLTVTATDNGCEAFVNLSGYVVSDCSMLSAQSNNSPFANFPDSLDASGTYPVGNYQIILSATDACGNSSQDTVNLVVEGAGVYTYHCIKIVRLITDNLTVTVPVSEHYTESGNCDGILHQTSYNINNPLDTLKTFTCADLGDIITYLYFFEDGVFVDSCRTLTTILDPTPFCSNIIGKVKGNILTENFVPVAGTEINLNESSMGHAMSNEIGQYEFPEMEAGGSYQVKPIKDGDYLDGVSTLDMIMIQRHILRAELLNSPYKMVAADINNDNKISTSDIVELRKNLLGLKNGFVNNRSWKTIDAEFKFPVPKDPFATAYPTTHEIFGLQGTKLVDFIGVKIGDVNGTFKAHLSHTSAETRSQHALSILDRKLSKGETFEVKVNLSNEQQLTGLQLALQLNGADLINVESDKFDENELYYNTLADNTLRIIATKSKEAVDVQKGVFTLQLKSNRDAWLHELMDIAKGEINSELYDSDLETYGLNIVWEERGSDQLASELTQNTPNPWKDKTSISYVLADEGKVSIEVKDATGKILYSEQFNGVRGSNHFELTSEMINGANGVLFFELKTSKQNMSRKMIRLN